MAKKKKKPRVSGSPPESLDFFDHPLNRPIEGDTPNFNKTALVASKDEKGGNVFGKIARVAFGTAAISETIAVFAQGSATSSCGTGGCTNSCTSPCFPTFHSCSADTSFCPTTGCSGPTGTEACSTSAPGCSWTGNCNPTTGC